VLADQKIVTDASGSYSLGLKVKVTRVHRSTAHTPQPPNTKIQKFLKLTSKGTKRNI
jgi:hypothetical protein